MQRKIEIVYFKCIMLSVRLIIIFGWTPFTSRLVINVRAQMWTRISQEVNNSPIFWEVRFLIKPMKETVLYLYYKSYIPGKDDKSSDSNEIVLS